MIRRRVFNFGAAVSLLLCVATMAAWFRKPYFVFHTSSDEYVFRCLPMDFRITILEGTLGEGGEFHSPPGRRWHRNGQIPTIRLPLGFTYRKSTTDDPMAAFYFDLTIPWWFLIVIFSLVPSVRIGLFLRRAQASRNCKNCSYDLTGNTSGVCPECGTPVGGKAVKA